MSSRRGRGPTLAKKSFGITERQRRYYAERDRQNSVRCRVEELSVELAAKKSVRVFFRLGWAPEALPRLPQTRRGQAKPFS